MSINYPKRNQFFKEFSAKTVLVAMVYKISNVNVIVFTIAPLPELAPLPEQFVVCCFYIMELVILLCSSDAVVG